MLGVNLPRRPVLLKLLLGLAVLSVCLADAPTAALESAGAPATTPDVALQQILGEARAEAAKSCAVPTDLLEAIICAGTIRVGVRDNYPPFASIDAGDRTGFEIGIARDVARELGVTVAFVTVSPADRIALLAESRIDLTIATMGDTTLRDSQARFIRPHYYSSNTAVVGPHSVPMNSLASLAGHTICVTVGNASNGELAASGGRLLFFASPEQLIDELRSGACSLVAQDNTFFARYFADPQFSALYKTEFTIDPLPWGMAVPLAGGERLATALSLISEIFHRDGVYLKLAEADHVSPEFLSQQRTTWLRRDCDTVEGFTSPRCVLSAHRSDVAETSFAGAISEAEGWAAHLGFPLSLDIFKLQPAWGLVRDGIRNSLILVFGTVSATLAFSLLLGRALSARSAVLRWPARGLTILLQSTPPVLALVIAASVANGFFTFSAMLAMSAAIVALGLINGGSAGQAISEAVASLRAEQTTLRRGYPPPLTERQIYAHALGRSSTQIVAFLINATKATPMASFIGAPELLNALTDSNSFSSDRATSYWLMLIFYVAVVMLVILLCSLLRRTLKRRLIAI